MNARAAFVALLFAPLATAGLYSSVEKPPFDFTDDGAAKALPSSGFHSQLADVLDAVAAPRDQKPPPNSLWAGHAAMLASLSKKLIDELTPDELRDLSAAMIRLGKTDDAMDLLRPLSRDRRANFFTWTHLAHVSALKEQWGEAREAQQIGKAEFPDAMEGFTPAAWKWYRKVERDYYLRWLQLRSNEARAGTAARVAEGVDAIFGDVKFVGDDGTYQPGTIAATEKAKLPPDALAIAQQLALWSPGDTRLYWLVGELFNANGDPAAAAAIFDACVGDSRRYQNPTLSEHRRVLKEYLADKDEAKRKAETDAWKPDEWRVWLVLGLSVPVVILLVRWQFRDIRRRMRK